jgi:hypothetical protein
LFPLFATGAIDAGGKFTASVIDTCGNMPPVSMTQAVMVAQFTTNVIDNCGKFASGVVDTSKLCTLTCEYLSEFSKKFEMTRSLYSWTLGKMIHKKNLTL